MTTITQALEFIIKGIVSDPSSIVIESTDSSGIEIITISAAPEVVGQIIGKEGKIIKSIRTILNLSFPTIRYSLDIKE